MRIYFTLIAAIALLPAACKKEIREINAPATSKRANPNCTGNTWTPDQAYPNVFNSSYFYSPPLVYNNKVYLFHASQDIVRIYDGTSWNSKPSQIPYTGIASFGFVIGNKGYLGRGTNTSQTHFFYEYNFAANTWSRKAGFPGVQRSGTSTFSIGNKGYVVGGFGVGIVDNLNDTWAYSPATNTWTQKASFPFARGQATGFSIDNKGYIVNGVYRLPDGAFYYNTLLEYDPVTNDWDSKASFPGEARSISVAFVISGSAYVGGGRNIIGDEKYYKDYYKYKPGANSWTKIASPPVSNHSSFAFSINSMGYVGFNDTTMFKYIPRTCISPPGPTPNQF